LIFGVVPISVVLITQASSECTVSFCVREQDADGDRDGERNMPRAAVLSAVADAFVRRIDDLRTAAGTPRRLADVGLSRDRLTWLAENSGGASMRGNPVSLDPQALLPILERIW
jgi:alcohol dehydrogenase class IV